MNYLTVFKDRKTLIMLSEISRKLCLIILIYGENISVENRKFNTRLRKVILLTHRWEQCQADHRKPDLYSHNDNNSLTKYTSIHGRLKHELAKNQTKS